MVTGAELYAMGDIGPTELVRGEIVYYSPNKYRHGLVENLINSFLHLYLINNRIGRVCVGGVGVFTKRNPDTVRAVDLLFISYERLARAQADGYLDVAPELVVEIMSPGNSWSEVQEKLAEYFAVGVLMVWVVDPQMEQIHVYRSLEQVKLVGKQGVLTGEDVLPGFEVALLEIFAA